MTSPSTSTATSGPLSDLLVVDLTRALAGPHATQMLGDLGARVIKVEAPGNGDDTRGWGPPFVGEPDARQSTYFLCTNRNKESIALDLKDAADKDVLVGLVERADVLVENFRTGVLERLGLGIEELMRRNPRLVVLSITGFGHDGPEGGRAGYDQIAQGEAGLMSLTGSGPDDPQRVGVPIADLLSGMYGAYGVLAALHEPAVLLLDEPFDGVDPLGVEATLEVVADARARGACVLLSTHLRDFALEACGEAVVLRGGNRVAAMQAGDLTGEAYRALLD
ncbi:hypothetical protein Pve01_80110 [Planomonospora venezuelensis]|nr:hypothetical protein Pve01_80110 [Planomonospora venezuelensis]